MDLIIKGDKSKLKRLYKEISLKIRRSGLVMSLEEVKQVKKPTKKSK